jgi:hypothetical protein
MENSRRAATKREISVQKECQSIQGSMPLLVQVVIYLL